jgi:ABC-type multidrug transport system fused ATPase/permease subunit
MMGASVGSLPDLYASIQKSIGATENLMNIINEKTEKAENTGTSKSPIQGDIEFKNVSFSYPQRKDMTILKNVSFGVERNKTLALVGPSGSGKSTISNLILNFYHANSGEIKIDNQLITDYDLNYLRQHMAIVPQDVLLFSGSILENIRFGNTDATEQEVIEAAKKANAWEFIDSFPEKLATEVGDRGIQLSGGQKQRIAIARAILKNPQILILDEATSALDSESERLVQDALDKLMKGRTSVVIAHRLSTIRNADNIIVLQHGDILESGTHQELIEKKGLYADLVALQTMEG